MPQSNKDFACDSIIKIVIFDEFNLHWKEHLNYSDGIYGANELHPWHIYSEC